MAYVTREGDKFMYRGRRFRFIGFNNYTMQVDSPSASSLRAGFGAARRHGVTVFRTWCFDVSRRTTTNSLGNFRYLTTTSGGSDILSNGTFETNTVGWGLDSQFTRSNTDAHSGSYSIAQVSPSGSYQNFTTVNDANGIAVTPNTSYTFKFWYKLTVSGFPPLISINSGNAYGSQIANGALANTSGAWVQASLTFNSGANSKVWFRLANNGGAVTAFYDDFTLTSGTGYELAWVESTLVHLDTLLDEARRAGIKLILSLADNNMYFGGYETKITYFNWANTIYNAGLVNTENYFEFFRSPFCRTLFKQFVYGLANRINTINGRLYKTDDTIMSWELGNEMRIDQGAGDTNADTVNSRNIQLMKDWATDISSYIKSIDPNHLVNFNSGTHAYGRAYDPGGSGQQDSVWNGSYYGVDYNTLMAIPSLDFVSCNSYPNQGMGSSNILNFGFQFGYTRADRAEGYKAQLRDFIAKAKANGKPLVMGEIGYAREDTGTFPGWPMYPRDYAFFNVFKEIFDNDGDGVIIWSATATGGGSFSVGMDEYGTASYWGSNENKNSSGIMHKINALNTQLVAPGKRPRSV